MSIKRDQFFAILLRENQKLVGIIITGIVSITGKLPQSK